mgnify:CR=1 FL=1
MKTTGIVRQLDSLGRIVIPKEMRRLFDLEDGVSYLDISVIDDTIVLKKFDPDPKCLRDLPQRTFRKKLIIYF